MLKKRRAFFFILNILLIFNCNAILAFKTLSVRWANSDIPVKYVINSSGAPEGFVAAIQAAFKTWEDVPTSSISFTYLREENRFRDPNDNTNTIVWYADHWNPEWATEGNPWPAVTFWTPSPEGGHIIDADIAFNGKDYQWTSSPLPCLFKFDVQNITTHEIGHFLGLADLYEKDDTEKTMYGFSSDLALLNCETKKRTLHEDDIAGVSYLYPTVGYGAPNPQLFVDCYNRNGGSAFFGYPINNVHKWGNGLIQDFRENGNELAIMQPDGVNKAYAIYGAIWLKYKSLAIEESGSQYPPSYLGYPISDEKDAPKSGAEGFNTTGRVSDFQIGHIWWLRERNLTFETHGAIDGLYTSIGNTGSWLGFPMSDEYKDSKTGYARSDFEDGYITTLDGINYQAFRKQPTQPSITVYSLTPITAESGTTLTIKYTINNPTSSTMALALGCSIQKAGTTTWISDPSNDKVVNVSPGSGNYSREFVLLSTLSSGKYNVAWGLWNSTLTTSYDYKQSNDALIIVDKGTTCFFADLDCNNKVDMTDIRLIALHWDTQVGDTLYDAQYDFNSDGRINLLDVRMVAQYWGQTAPFNPPAAPVVDVLISENTEIDAAIVKINPSNQQVAINTKAIFNIEIEKVSNLGGVEFTLRYDPKIIEIKTDDIALGDFLPKNRVLLLGPQFKDMSGFRELTYGFALLGNEHGSSGNGILAQIAVKGLSSGITSLDLRDVNLIDASLEVKRIPLAVKHGSITVLPNVMAGIEEQATIQNNKVDIGPIHNRLLQNYPNPFNPETWIPFELANEADVIIRIFNVQGQLIQTLDFGHKETGVYHSKDRAAYWDGKTQSGESASSGIYFYTIQADEFTASRKMMLMR